MFSRFIKNKILSVLVLVSSLSYGAQSKNTESDEVHPQSQERAKALSSTDKIYVNNMPFYIPPEEPSLEERKKKAVLMYWEHLDPKTGKISVIRYPDTLKVKEEPTEVYDDSDLTPWPWFYQKKSVSAPKPQPVEIAPKPISITNSVTQVKSVETKISEPDPLEKILEGLEAEEKKIQQESVKSNTTASCESLLPSPTNSLPQVNHVCEQNVREVEELLNALKETPQKETFQPIPTNEQKESPLSVITNALPNIKSQNTQEIEELLTLLSEENLQPLKSSETNQTQPVQSPVLTNVSIHSETPVQKRPVFEVTNQNIRDFDDLLAALNQANSVNPNSQTDTSKTKSLPSERLPIAPKKERDDLDELLKDLEKEGMSTQQSSHTPHNSPITNGGIALSALGGSALLGMSKLRRRKKKSDTKQTQLNLISTEQISKDQTEKRNELANKLKAIRTIEDIKKRRQVLSKQLRLARANNDEQTIQSILDIRKELTQKRRLACLCITDPYTCRIKEERRLLTKKMTLARKKKDLQTMSQITQKREHLKEKVKSLNAYIREFDYTQKRSSFLKANTIKLILSHQNQKS